MEDMKCMICEHVLRESKDTNVFNHYTDAGVIDKTLLVKNLPMLVCSNPECGEEYFGADPMEKIEALLKKISSLEGEYFVADFETEKVFKMTITEEV
jgi:hypothetical protein